MSSFGERLKRARQNAGLSQAALGGQVYSVSYISRLEAGRRSPSPDVVAHCERMLGVPRGTLLAGDWAIPCAEASAERPPGPSELAVLVSRAMQAWRNVDLDTARELVAQGIPLASALDRPDSWWQLGTIDIQASLWTGEYRHAAARAEDILTHPWVLGIPDLHAQAAILASQAHRLADQHQSARRWATHAVQLTSDYAIGDVLAMQAGIALIASGAPYDEKIPGLLADSIEATPDRHTAGIGCWTLGNIAFRDGHPQEGLAWHTRADDLITPAADFRDWARFARSSASERLRADILTGVPELLTRARMAIPRLNNPNENVALTLAEAEFATKANNDLQRASDLLTNITYEGVKPSRHKEALLQHAELLRELGDHQEAAELALRAAKINTTPNRGKDPEVAVTGRPGHYTTDRKEPDITVHANSRPSTRCRGRHPAKAHEE